MVIENKENSILEEKLKINTSKMTKLTEELKNAAEEMQHFIDKMGEYEKINFIKKIFTKKPKYNKETSVKYKQLEQELEAISIYQKRLEKMDALINKGSNDIILNKEEIDIYNKLTKELAS